MIKAYCIRGSKSPVVSKYMDILRDGALEAGVQTEDIPIRFHNIDKDSLIISDSPLVAIKYILRGFHNNVVWFQGVQPEESYLRRKSKIRYLILSLIEKIVLERALWCFFVSDDMKDHYISKYKIDLNENCTIIPCFNEESVYPDAFIKNDSIIEFVYVGGMQEWQCFEDTVKIYKDVERLYSGGCKFSVYTADEKKAECILTRYGIKSFGVGYVKPSDLHESIKTANYGFVLRHDSIVNNVSTPTKISNYIANGIIPIYSPTIHSFASKDREIKLGICCDEVSAYETANRIVKSINEGIDMNDLRSKCIEFFDDYYSKSKYVEIVGRVLSSVNVC